MVYLVYIKGYESEDTAEPFLDSVFTNKRKAKAYAKELLLLGSPIYDTQVFAHKGGEIIHELYQQW